MAIVYGESGAWKDACRPLHYVGLFPEDPAHIQEVLAPLEQQWAQSWIDATAAYDQQTLQHAAWVQAKQAEHQAAVTRLQAEYDNKISAFHQKLQADTTTPGLASRIRRWLWYLPLHARRMYLRSQYQRKLAILDQIPNQALEAQRRHLAVRDQFLHAYTYPVGQRIAAVKYVLESPEYAGAIGELDVLQHLQALPDDFAVLADVWLRYNRHLYYEGQHLQSAQIDFIVIGPPGVFLIEVKLWSRAFLETGHYRDPYEQCDRASYLCHMILKEYGLPPKLRTIIATRSQMPPRSPNSYVQVLTPEALCRYIQNCQTTLSPNQIEQLTVFLRNWQVR